MHQKRMNQAGLSVAVEQREQTDKKTDVAGIAGGVCDAPWNPYYTVFGRAQAAEWLAACTCGIILMSSSVGR